MGQEENLSRRYFLKNSMLSAGGIAAFGFNKPVSEITILNENIKRRAAFLQAVKNIDGESEKDWLQTARVFLLDAYQPPLNPHLHYDADTWAEMMAEMNVNVIRLGTMGKYATVQGIRFATNPGQGNRDLLQETIVACKSKGIKVFAYISTGHKLAWSMVTKDYPEYAQQTTPGGLPDRDHMYVGEDMGTVCWQTPYKDAWFDYVTHVVRDYDVDGMYFDKFVPFYFWPGKQLCYCNWCRKGFYDVTHLEIPYHKNDADYTSEDFNAIDKYHEWYKEKFITEVVQKVRPLVKSYKDVPLMSNINNPQKMASVDPRISNVMDAFLYERGNSMLERAEGIGVPRSAGLNIWPYVGTYHNWPHLAFQGMNYQQQIFTNLSFGAGSIVAQPTGYIKDTENRKYVSYPFSIIKKYQSIFKGLRNYPYIGVLFSYKSPKAYIKEGWHTGVTDARTSTLGAFSACLYNHLQVSSISEFVLDDPEKLERYPVLYLANVPYLNKRRIKNIKDYVRNGGCLITSNATTLYNESGERQTTFDLEELMSVKPIQPGGDLAYLIENYTSMTGGPNDLYLLASSNNKTKEIFDEEWKERLFPLWYYQPVKVLDGGETIMDIVTGYNKEAVLPGVVVTNFGKGKVLYCSSALEAFYNNDKPEIIGQLLEKFVTIVSKEAPPYTLDAPDGLFANLTRKDNLLVLHLTNWTGNKYEKNLMNEYYLAPVKNASLKIRIPYGKKIKNVFTLIDKQYDKKIKDQEIELHFPEVEAYQAVVVELD